MARFNSNAVYHWKPSSVEKTQYSNQLKFHGVSDPTGFYYLSKFEVLMITFPQTITLEIGRHNWGGHIDLITTGSTPGHSKGYSVRVTDKPASGESGTWRITFIKGKIYKFIGNGKHNESNKPADVDVTTKGVMFTTKGYNESQYTTGVNSLRYKNTTFRAMKSNKLQEVATFEPVRQTFTADSQGKYFNINYLDWSENDTLHNPITGIAYRPAAIVTTSSGTNQHYTQSVYKYSGVDVYYTKDTGSNNIDRAWNVMGRIPILKNSSISFKYKRGTYSNSSGWSDYHVFIERATTKGEIWVSENSNIPKQHKLKINEHRLMKVLDGRGSWIQIWIYNYDGWHYGIKLGAGSGIGTAFTCIIDWVRTDGYDHHTETYRDTSNEALSRYTPSEYKVSGGDGTTTAIISEYTPGTPFIIDTHTLPRTFPNFKLTLASSTTTLFPLGISKTPTASGDNIRVSDVKIRYLKIGFFKGPLHLDFPYLIAQADMLNELSPEPEFPNFINPQ